jgi:hypothetical protein
MQLNRQLATQVKYERVKAIVAGMVMSQDVLTFDAHRDSLVAAALARRAWV